MRRDARPRLPLPGSDRGRRVARTGTPGCSPRPPASPCAEVVFGYLLAVALALALAVALHLSAPLRRAFLPLLVLSQTDPDRDPRSDPRDPARLRPRAEARRGGDRLLLPDRRQRGRRVPLDRPGARAHDAHAARQADSRSSCRVELPGALPAIFSGARVAATYAAVGAVFGEWAGSSAGLGFVILQAQPALQTARIFAAVIVLSAIALALYAAVTLAERLLVPWQHEAARALGAPLLALAALAAVLCPLAAAGQRAVTLTLDWTPNPDHVGLYYAQQERAVRSVPAWRSRFARPPTRPRRSSSSPPATPTSPSPTNRSSSSPRPASCR